MPYEDWGSLEPAVLASRAEWDPEALLLRSSAGKAKHLSSVSSEA